LNHSYPLFSREERLLFGVFQDGDHDPVEDPETPFDDVHVPVGDGVEGSGVDGARIPHLDPQLVPHLDLVSKYQKKRGLSTKILGEKGGQRARCEPIATVLIRGLWPDPEAAAGRGGPEKGVRSHLRPNRVSPRGVIAGPTGKGRPGGLPLL
jgi:hypothetical protein